MVKDTPLVHDVLQTDSEIISLFRELDYFLSNRVPSDTFCQFMIDEGVSKKDAKRFMKNAPTVLTLPQFITYYKRAFWQSS